jgi:hypothetical protein
MQLVFYSYSSLGFSASEEPVHKNVLFVAKPLISSKAMATHALIKVIYM